MIRRAVISLGGALARVRGVPFGHRVIAAHEVPDAGHFRGQLLRLLDHVDLVPLDALWDADPDRPRLSLTFDDGYASWHDVAAPVLEDLAVPATFFVCSGFVGLRADEAADFRRGRLRRTQPLAPLTTDQLAALAASRLFEVGSHTVSHRDLGGNTSEATLVAEIDADRERLHAVTGAPVRYFAYPFGEAAHVGADARRHVEASGFEAAFTTVPGRADGAPDRYRLPRVMIEADEDGGMWLARVRGGAELAARVRDVARVAPGRSR